MRFWFHQIAVLLLLAGCAIAASYWFFPVEGGLPSLVRGLAIGLALLCSVPVHWLWLWRMRSAVTQSQATAPGLIGAPLRLFGLMLLCLAMALTNRDYVWPAAVIYVVTAGTFLCFQVVTAARHQNGGGGP